MGRNILYVFDETSDTAKVVRHCGKKDIGKIFLCPVTTDETAVSAVLKGLSALRECTVEILPYLKSFDKTAFSERNNFIGFVSRLGSEAVTYGRKSLKEYFQYPRSSFSAWWVSSIVEKDPVKSDTYHNLIRVLTILKLREECGTNDIIIDTAFREVSRTLKANSSRFGYSCKDFRNQRKKTKTVLFCINLFKGLKLYLYWAYKVFITPVYTKGLDFRREILEKARYASVTYFPFVDQKGLEQKKFIDKYYNSLQTLLENRHKDEFVWLAMDSDVGGLGFRKKLRLGRKINRWNYPVYFMEEWTGLKDLFIIFARYIYFAAKFFAKIPCLSGTVRYSESKIDIGPLLEEDWFTSFAGSALMSGIIYYTAFKNISGKLKKGAMFMYLAENKAWERALNSALAGRKEVRSLAIIHTAVPLLTLPFFDYPDGLEAGEDGKFAMPNPDFLACNGRIPLELLRRSGWSGRKAFLWFALRYQHLKKHLQNNISWERRQNKILVALPYSAAQARELLHYIHQAFGADTGYQIIIKGHYSLPLKSLVERSNLGFNRKIFVFSDETIDRFLPLVKAMVVTGSSAALESIAFGCPVIIPKLSGMVDMNPLSGISDFPVYAWSPGELKSRVDEIMCRKESPLSYGKYKKFIEDYFEFFNSEDDLAEGIKERL